MEKFLKLINQQLFEGKCLFTVKSTRKKYEDCEIYVAFLSLSLFISFYLSLTILFLKPIQMSSFLLFPHFILSLLPSSYPTSLSLSYSFSKRLFENLPLVFFLSFSDFLRLCSGLFLRQKRVNKK